MTRKLYHRTTWRMELRQLTMKAHLGSINICAYRDYLFLYVDQEFYNTGSKIWGTLPKKIWVPRHAKFRSILYNLRLWLRISPQWLTISKIGKLVFPDRFLLLSTKKVRWTLAHKLQICWCEFGPIKMHFMGYYISAIRECCALKFLNALHIDLALLAHTRTRRGSPKKF